MNRRAFCKASASISLAWIGGAFWYARSVLGQQKEESLSTVRRVQPGDEAALLALMQSCVGTRNSFHGLCNAVEWTNMWAEGVVSDRPRSLVVTREEVIVAYFDLPDRMPRSFGDEKVDHYEHAFWCGAAGVRMDLLGEEQSIRVFQQLLYEAFSDALSQGFEFVRAAAPWEQHPYLPKPFTAYPGLTSTPFEDDNGARKYLLEWRLADAVEALANEDAFKDVALS